ncbi:hypothetical protein [Sphingobacterium sp.]|uniref:hypothetical protein n=1 Tax=Sphingobacterium sp. TaxID=341027 RepID=UPI00289FF690|nr:hypothetical protein [Sphingobacterium sp.]
MKYTISLLFLFWVSSLRAQQDSVRKIRLPLEVIYFGGVQFNNASNLNRILKQEGAGKFPGFGWNAGAGIA